MNQQILTDNTAVYYVAKVGGKEVSQRRTTREQAIADLSSLSESLKAEAQIVPVDASGRQVLLG